MGRLAGWCRWLARLGATALAALFVAFIVGDGRPDLREITDRELAGFAAVLVMMIGTLLAWRWDWLGGLLLLAGFGAFTLIEDGWPPLPFAGFLLAGALLILSFLLRRVAAARSAPATATAGTAD